MSIKLYVLPGSHPCAAVEVALRRKGIPFRASRPAADDAGRGGAAALRRPHRSRGCGSTASDWSARARSCAASTLLAPEPPLLPADPAEREPCWRPSGGAMTSSRACPGGSSTRASCATRGDGELRRRRQATAATGLLRPALPLTAKLMARRNHAQRRAVRADLAALSGQLEKIDAWIADGLLGGEEPNAADLQIGSTIRLLETIGDVRPLIEGHPPRRRLRATSRRWWATFPRERCRRSGCRRPPRQRRIRGRRPSVPSSSARAFPTYRASIPQRRPRPPHALGERQRRKRVGEAATVGGAQLEVELQRGNQHEAAGEQLLVGQRSCARGAAPASPSSRMSMSIARGPWRGPPAARPSSRSMPLTASSSSSGSSAVRTRRQAFRKLG